MLCYVSCARLCVCCFADLLGHQSNQILSDHEISFTRSSLRPLYPMQQCRSLTAPRCCRVEQKTVRQRRAHQTKPNGKNFSHEARKRPTTTQVEKQQNERQRKFSHSRGVAPATQLDYPLFGNGASGPRRRGRPAAPPPPPAPAAAGPLDGDDEDNKGHKTSGRAAGVGLAASTAAAVVSSLPFPSGRPGGGVGRSSGGVTGGSGGSGGQGGSSWPQKPGPPPWPAERYANKGSAVAPPGVLGAGGPGFGHGAGATSAPAHSNGSGFSGHGRGLGNGRGGAPPGVPLHPPEPPRASSGATGLRKRPGES